MEGNCRCKKNQNQRRKSCADDYDETFWQNVVEKYKRRRCKLERREIELRERLEAMESQMPMLLMMNVMKQVQASMPKGGLCGKRDERRGCGTVSEPYSSEGCNNMSRRPYDRGEVYSKRAKSVPSNNSGGSHGNMDCTCSGGQISVKTLDSSDNVCVQALHLLTTNERRLKDRISELEEQEASLAKAIAEATQGLGMSGILGGGPMSLDELKKRNEELAKENKLLKERQCLMYQKKTELAQNASYLDAAIKECEQCEVCRMNVPKDLFHTASSLKQAADLVDKRVSKGKVDLTCTCGGPEEIEYPVKDVSAKSSKASKHEELISATPSKTSRRSEQSKETRSSKESGIGESGTSSSVIPRETPSSSCVTSGFIASVTTTSEITAKTKDGEESMVMVTSGVAVTSKSILKPSESVVGPEEKASYRIEELYPPVTQPTSSEILEEAGEKSIGGTKSEPIVRTPSKAEGSISTLPTLSLKSSTVAEVAMESAVPSVRPSVSEAPMVEPSAKSSALAQPSIKSSTGAALVIEPSAKSSALAQPSIKSSTGAALVIEPSAGSPSIRSSIATELTVRPSEVGAAPSIKSSTMGELSVVTAEPSIAPSGSVRFSEQMQPSGSERSVSPESPTAQSSKSKVESIDVKVTSQVSLEIQSPTKSSEKVSIVQSSLIAEVTMSKSESAKCSVKCSEMDAKPSVCPAECSEISSVCPAECSEISSVCPAECSEISAKPSQGSSVCPAACSEIVPISSRTSSNKSSRSRTEEGPVSIDTTVIKEGDVDVIVDVEEIYDTENEPLVIEANVSPSLTVTVKADVPFESTQGTDVKCTESGNVEILISITDNTKKKLICKCVPSSKQILPKTDSKGKECTCGAPSASALPSIASTKSSALDEGNKGSSRCSANIGQVSETQSKCSANVYAKENQSRRSVCLCPDPKTYPALPPPPPPPASTCECQGPADSSSPAISRDVTEALNQANKNVLEALQKANMDIAKAMLEANKQYEELLVDTYLLKKEEDQQYN